MTDNLDAFIKPGPTVESDHPDVAAFARRAAGDAESDKDKAINLYYAVRDEFRYDPYSSSLDVAGLSASRVLRERRGYCVSKAVLLAAACRAEGIPARLGFADVRNHLATEKMRERMKTDVFYWHGYTAIYLDGKWVKSTPAFNIELCEKFGLLPLEFDGETDSIFHPFDAAGEQHMEYLNFRGEYAEPPIADMRRTYDEYYTHWQASQREQRADFDAEVAADTGADKR